MLGSVWTEAIIVLLLILANGFFAAAEIAIVSARHSRLQQQADAGKSGARMALNLAKNPDRFLATVQVGMTLINTLAAAFGGASISVPVAQWLRAVPFLAPYASSIALAIVVLLITYCTLILGELVPKRLALQSAENIASNAAPFMTTMSRVLSPAVALLSGTVNLVLRILGQSKATRTTITEEDIVYMTHEGIASGTVEQVEEEFISRIFRFTDRPVSDVMKPRTEIVAVEMGTPLVEVIDTFVSSGYTRIPCYKDTLDNVIGVLYAKDLLRPHLADEHIELATLIRPAFFISEYQHVDDLLTTFRRNGIHLAVVIDEYSQVTGLVTLEDVLEELVGEIQDEYDEPENSSIVQREDGSWLVDGMIEHETVQEKIGLQDPEESGDYKTLAGMVLAHMGRIPTTGDTITIGDFVLEIVDMDGRRIDKILIKQKKVQKN